MPVDVLVVGAGPAGATCALHLARAGLGVILADKAEPPRYKTCGGGIVGRALAELDIDVGAAVERRCHRLELRVAGAGVEHTVERADPPVVMTMRSAFDACLVEAAVTAGVSLRAPLTISGLRPVEGGIELATNRGELRAALVVAADGAGSRVARAAGWGPSRQPVPAIESEMIVESPVFERQARAARFDFGVVPFGYGWVFPKRTHLSVGCLTTVPRAGSLTGFFEHYLEHLGLTEARKREDHGFAIPTRPRARCLARDRVLLVGDAAGLADPVTCEGITNAIRSGKLAARAAIEERRGLVRTAARYQQLLNASILPELRLARLLAPFLYEYPRLQRFMFRRLGERFCDAFTDLHTGRRTYRDLLTGLATYKHLLGGLMRLRRS